MSVEDFESRVNQVIILVFTVIGIGLGLSLFQIAFERILPELQLTHIVFLLLLAIVLVSVLLALSIRIILPPMKIVRNIYCKLLFNTNTGTFINPEWYLSWYPAQMAADLAIRVSTELDSVSTNNYVEALFSSIPSIEMSQLIEYVVFYWLARSSPIMHAMGMPRILSYGQFPSWLKDNFFIKKFHEFQTNKFGHLGNITLSIPEGFSLLSYYPGNNINLFGKHLQISINPKSISILPVRHMLTEENSSIPPADLQTNNTVLEDSYK